jgi:hypothetical protein
MICVMRYSSCHVLSPYTRSIAHEYIQGRAHETRYIFEDRRIKQNKYHADAHPQSCHSTFLHSLDTRLTSEF